MQYEISHLVFRFSFFILFITLVAVNAKPPHFSEPTQGFNTDQDPSSVNLMDSELRPWPLELIAQRMAEINRLNQMNNLNGQDFGSFDRALRSSNEIKRQSRYRLCYFNPVSCF